MSPPGRGSARGQAGGAHSGTAERHQDSAPLGQSALAAREAAWRSAAVAANLRALCAGSFGLDEAAAPLVVLASTAALWSARAAELLEAEAA